MNGQHCARNGHSEKTFHCNRGLCCTTIRDFSVWRGKSEIFKHVDLHIHCGDLTALIGPNGSGKTTLLKAILGEIPHSGELDFLDHEGNRLQPIIGYVPQKLDFDPSSPTTVLDLFAATQSKRPVWLGHSAQVRIGVRESLSRVEGEYLIDRKLGALSGGELQRVLLALALDPMPNLLLLDEPVSGIDQNGMKMFYQTVSTLRQNYDLSIILVSHDLDLVAEYADKVVLLNNQKVECCGTPEEVYGHETMMHTFGLSRSPGVYLRKRS